jgi:ketosteroid isomerase-like protein
MTDTTPAREPAREPNDLERLLIVRQHAGDVEGMLALFAADAVMDPGDGRLLRGRDAIRGFFAAEVAAGRKWAVGAQRPALVMGELALTSTRLPDGTVTAEVARRQPDGSWLWVIDRFSVT